MSNIKELMELGKELGYTGEALQKFIREERDEIKRQKEIEREEAKRKEDLEREEAKRKEDLEREERAYAREEKKRLEDMALEEKKRQEDLALEEKKLQIERERMKHEMECKKMEADSKSNKNGNNDASGTHTSKAVKMPKFDEKADTMDAYIHRFEFLATNKNVNKSQWSLCLAENLSGTSLEVLQSMSKEDASDYDKLKNKLLDRFKYNQDGYRKLFKSCKPKPDENFETFFDKLRQSLDKWITASDIKDGEYDKLRCLILFEQLYDSCNPNLVRFLKERNPSNENEIKENALLYERANPGTKLGHDERIDIGAVGYQRESRPTHRNNAHFNQKRNGTPYRNQSEYDKRRGGYRKPTYNNNYSNRGDLNQEQRSNSQHRGNNYPQTQRSNSQQRGNNYQNHNRGNFRGQTRGNRYNNQTGQYNKRYNSQAGQYSDNNYTNQPSQYFSNVRSGNAAIEMNQEDNCETQNCTNQIIMSAYASNASTATNVNNLILFDGKVNGNVVKILRDTGANCNAVRRNLVKQGQIKDDSIQCKQFGGSFVEIQQATIHIKSPFYTGWIRAAIVDDPVVDLILGNDNLMNDKPLIDALQKSREQYINDPNDKRTINVTTRAQTQKESEKSSRTGKVELPQNKVLEEFNGEEFRTAQHTDSSLNNWINKAKNNPEGIYKLKDNVLYKSYSSNGNDYEQLVVPKSFRQKLLHVAHDSIASGHMGMASTKKRLESKFTWPGMYTDVNNYVKSCHICQMKARAEPPLPLGKMQVIGTPWKKCAFDIAGPLPLTDKKNRYILALVDYATRWPECVPMKAATTEEVTKALLSIFSRMGIPEETLSDNAQAFISDAMNETMKLLGIERKNNTPYHSQSNGLCERFIGTIKKIIGKLASDHPTKWDQMLDTAMFAYREIPQASTNFSPFTLMFGRKVRGPIDIVHDICSGKQSNEHFTLTYNYVNELKDNIQKMCKLAQENREEKADTYKQYADRGSRTKTFKEGDKVLLLLPMKENSMKMAFQGPYEIETVCGQNNYTIKIGNNSKTYHANILKYYHERPNNDLFCNVGNVSVVFEDEDSECEPNPQLELPALTRTKSAQDVIINKELTGHQINEVTRILEAYDDILTDIPGRTNVVEHKISVIDNKVINTKQYPIPLHARDAVKEEVQKMLQWDIIRESDSAFCSPITIVKKKDGKLRICLDYRKINANCYFDAEPIPNQEELMSQIEYATYFCKIDLTKGYWQIPLEEDSKKYTAFQSPLGLMEFNFLPFGLAAASSTFQRMMRIVLRDINNVISYFDDILGFANTWNDFLVTLQVTFTALQTAGLTANPPKCLIGFNEVDFLGHTVGAGYQKPDSEKLTKIQMLRQPNTKKEVQSICGLLNYYRKFVPNYAEIARPLTDLTRKGKPNKVTWTAECEQSFVQLKQIMSSAPVLALPDLSKPFIIRSDASDYAIGGAIFQAHGGVIKPLLYASRKLNERECKYPIIEKEALAIVFTVGHFSKYLLLKPFTLQTDHKPLTFLKKNKTTNNRLMRWALALQRYTFTVEAIPGSENLISDILSRL